MYKLFDKEYRWTECLWGRAILPAGLGHYPDESAKQPGDRKVVQFDDHAPSAKLYTDGAGGDGKVARAARKAASAVAAVTFNAVSLGARVIRHVAQVTYRACGVPGDQTVPRAELGAAILAAQVPRCTGFATDSMYVQRADEQDGPARVMDGPNGLMWLEYFQSKLALGVKGPFARKVKAHDEEAFLQGLVDPEDFIGNLVADRVAGVTADMEIESLIDEASGRWSAIAYLVAMRIATIEAEVFLARPDKVALEDEVLVPLISEEQHLSDLHSAIAASEHTVISSGPFIRCTRCDVQVRKFDAKGKERIKAFRELTKAKCLPKGSDASLFLLGHGTQFQARSVGEEADVLPSTQASVQLKRDSALVDDMHVPPPAKARFDDSQGSVILEEPDDPDVFVPPPTPMGQDAIPSSADLSDWGYVIPVGHSAQA